MSKIIGDLKIVGICGDDEKLASKIIKHGLQKNGYKAEILEKLVYNHDADVLILNITEKNLDTLIPLDLLLQINTKKELIPFVRKVLKLVRTNGITIMNEDDENTQCILESNNERLVISYGMNEKSTLTASSIAGWDNIKLNCFLQRSIDVIDDVEVEPIEFPVVINYKSPSGKYAALGAIAILLLYGANPYKIYDDLQDLYI